MQDYERFQSGRVVLREVALDLHELLVEVKEELGFSAQGAARTIVLPEPASDGQWPLLGDRELLRQAIGALATYLLRQPRTTTLQFALQASADRGVRLTITSDGEAFADEDRQRVFEPYLRAPRRATLAYGLGMALARAIVDLHGGRSRWARPNRGANQASFVVELKSRDPLPNHP